MSSDHSGWKEAALGAVGGLAGTVAIQTLLAASQKWMPEAMTPMRDDPGHSMLSKAEKALPRNVRRKIPKAVEAGAGEVLAVGYGMVFGAVYAAMRRGRLRVWDGVALGIGAWAAGYLGWLPALGLMPPVSKQKAPQIAGPIVEHIIYGLTTVAAYDWLEEHVSA